MFKKEYRYFCGFLDKQQQYLNHMAQKGFRLVRVGKLCYEFESCKPDEFQYCIEFIADKSLKESKEYRMFLEEMGYHTFYKNINLNVSIGKIRWRPYGKGMGQLATNPGTYNKELLIAEKKNDGRKFELHTSSADKIMYYKALRNCYSCFLAFAGIMAALIGFGLIQVSGMFGDKNQLVMTTSLILGGFLLFVLVMKYQKRINKYKREEMVQE